MVEASRDLQRAFLPDVAFEHLAVIAYAGDDFDNPVIVEAKHIADLGVCLLTEDSFDFRIVRTLHLFDVRLRDAKLFSLDQREKRPLDDVKPLIVALADQRAKRLL